MLEESTISSGKTFRILSILHFNFVLRRLCDFYHRTCVGLISPRGNYNVKALKSFMWERNMLCTLLENIVISARACSQSK